MLRGLSQSGDTIVEVVIAMAIIGLILAGGYVTSTTSLHNETTSQETANALNLAESQTELMRALAGINVNTLNSAGGSAFCMIIDPSTSLPKPVPTSTPGTPCTVNVDGNTPTASQTSYNEQIAMKTVNSVNTFIIQVGWIPVGASVVQPNNQVQLEYRVQ